MGTASGAFTALFGIDFPKAIYKGNVLGYQFRAANSFRAGGLSTACIFLEIFKNNLEAQTRDHTVLCRVVTVHVLVSFWLFEIS